MYPDAPVLARFTELLNRAGRTDIAPVADRLRGVPLTTPNMLNDVLSRLLHCRTVVTGTLDRRLVGIELSAERGSWLLGDLSGRSHDSRVWPQWTESNLRIEHPESWISSATITSGGVHRLLRPRVLLAALYHAEHFPLPRFPLAISDLARAARTTLMGSVQLIDMQLGASLDTILATIRESEPDIVGVSATFGQHDLLVSVLEFVQQLPRRPLVVAGGSLTARNERMLVADYPWLLVARGAGEATITDLLSSWHGDFDRDRVRGLGFADAAFGDGALSIGRFRKTPTLANRAQTDILPELDLLAPTFGHRGVAQLESSRGCTNYCSFCPRGHKGHWSGASPASLAWMVDAIGSVLDHYPDLSRTLYLVDEEFIGDGSDAESRALEVANVIHTAGFRWETSCRVDQVLRADASDDWHRRRGHMWRALGRKGLRRCLFGVESGVTSILDRFNKETTAEQNILAIRTLSALGVPTRFTYITFDQLMTDDELRESYSFLARTDLLLRELPDLTVDEIVDGVRDERFVAQHSVHRPFYTAISYMLVSMECLIGAAYTKRVQAAGLADESEPSMGRLNARFADWRIGEFSRHAQLWVDRSFALDYTLKSLEKVRTGALRSMIRSTRVSMKDAGFDLLADMVQLLDHYPRQCLSAPELADRIHARMDHRMTRLREVMAVAVPGITDGMDVADAELLQAEFERWMARTEWTLINASDPCGS